MKAIAANSQLDFLSKTANELIIEQEPPKLQAVLRMVESRIKAFNNDIRTGKHSMTDGDIENLLKLTSESLS